MNTDDLIRSAEKSMAGEHPTYDWPIQNGTEKATAYALLALVAEQQRTNAQLASIDSSLSRIAKALEQLPEPTPKAQPALRLWLPGRRRAGA